MDGVLKMILHSVKVVCSKKDGWSIKNDIAFC